MSRFTNSNGNDAPVPFVSLKRGSNSRTQSENDTKASLTPSNKASSCPSFEASRQQHRHRRRQRRPTSYTVPYTLSVGRVAHAHTAHLQTEIDRSDSCTNDNGVISSPSSDHGHRAVRKSLGRSMDRLTLKDTASESSDIIHQRPSQDMTDAQIVEYAGKRALFRIEQDFSSYTKQSKSSQHPASSSSPHTIVRSIMNRRKFDRIPQVSKNDLIIRKFLGRGNFCDVFEVEWILTDQENMGGRFNERYSIGRSVSADLERRESRMEDGTGRVVDLNKRNKSGTLGMTNEDCSQMEFLSLSSENDLIPKVVWMMDDSSSAGTLKAVGRTARRSFSQICTSSNIPLKKCHPSSSLLNIFSTSTFRDKPYMLALKCLRPSARADRRKFVIGAEDLVHETALLACLDHPNIIKLHGRAEGCLSTMFQLRSSMTSQHKRDKLDCNEKKKEQCINDGYFIILDKLMATLTDRIEEWSREWQALHNEHLLKCTPSKVSYRLPLKSQFCDHLYKRLKVAYCIADALEYLHSCNVVFRDLKPANVGFDCNDCVKMFDFGFAINIAPMLNQQALDRRHRKMGYGPLTETCGTKRYMAPEVALKLGYGKEVDTYSFGILLWEICALEKPFNAIQNVEEFHEIVAVSNSRPPLDIDPFWTKSLKLLMKKCWCTNPLERPSMGQVKVMLCDVLRDLNIQVMRMRENRI